VSPMQLQLHAGCEMAIMLRDYAMPRSTARYIIARGTALCRLWLCAAATLDVKQTDSASLSCCCAGALNTSIALYCIDRTDNSQIGDRSVIRSDRSPIYLDRRQFRTSSKIGTFSSVVMSTSVSMFKNKLDDHWNDMGVKSC